jgi:hypothetical protein
MTKIEMISSQESHPVFQSHRGRAALAFFVDSREELRDIVATGQLELVEGDVGFSSIALPDVAPTQVTPVTATPNSALFQGKVVAFSGFRDKKLEFALHISI